MQRYKKLSKNHLLSTLFSVCVGAQRKFTIINLLQPFGLQSLAKKLQKEDKKSHKKKNNVSKKYLPLQRFKKQTIILQI